MMAHLVSLFGTEAKQQLVFNTMLYIPHSTRPHSEVLSRVGQMMAQMPRWQCSFVCTEPAQPVEVAAQLRGIVQAASAGVDQTEHERMMLSRGCQLNSMTILAGRKRSSSAGAAESPGPERAASEETESSAQSGRSGKAERSGGKSRAFQAPRRLSSEGAGSSALGSRAAGLKARLEAERAEEDAERGLQEGIKKKRKSMSESGTPRKKSKPAAPTVAPLEMGDVPAADE